MIEVDCPKCGYKHGLKIPKRKRFDGGEIRCHCGHLIIFYEELRETKRKEGSKKK